MVRTVATGEAPRGLRIHFHVNDQWHQENGLSVLMARDQIGSSPFALLMGDHLFEVPVLKRLLNEPTIAGETLLAVDSSPAPPDLVAEATKVRIIGDRIVDIGKSLAHHDALDTGMFVCQSSMFDAIRESCLSGDTTLSGGVRRLAARGLVRAIDIGTAFWCDVDTLTDLSAAQARVA